MGTRNMRGDDMKEVDIINILKCCLAWPGLLLASANDIPPNVCPHQPTINTMHGQSGQAWAQHWEPVYTHNNDTGSVLAPESRIKN